jgi:hypothetical protein
MANNLNAVSNNIQSIIDQILATETALKQNLSSPTITEALKIDITTRINELENIKSALLNQLNPLYTSFQTNVAVSNDTLSKQILALGIINAETLNSDRQFGLLTEETRDKTRLVEINTYYGKQYNAHKQIMKTIVLICIPVIILTILGNKGLLPNTFVVLFISFIIIFGIFSIGYQIIDLTNRDKMNYDEYNWKFNKSSAPVPEPSDGSPNINDPWASNFGTCIGSACCATIEAYNATTNTCCNSGSRYNSVSKACELVPVS